MNEVDGRPGHVALPTGHLDALKDAPKPSLRLTIHNAQYSDFPAGNRCVAPMILPGRMRPQNKNEGAIHEDVPGK